ncbi:MAG: nuclear transport factor 2 family protein [Solirubrobacterales bacterium]
MSPAADFAARFAAYWRAPSVAGLDALLAPDVRLVAPLTRTSEGLAEGKRAFAAILALVPDLTAEVHRWGPTEDGVLIDFTLSGSVGGTAVSWPAIDRIVLGEDGLARERVSRFDSLPLVLAVARSPRAWLPFARSRLRG